MSIHISWDLGQGQISGSCFSKDGCLWGISVSQTHLVNLSSLSRSLKLGIVQWWIKVLALFSIDTHFDASTTDSFWKHCGKQKNCSLRAISLFPAVFLTQSDICIPICSYFWHHIFICCWNGRALNWPIRKRVNTWCFNPFPDKPWFLRVCSTSLLKTLWEKEKLLVTSNFSFSHSVFYPLVELFVIFIPFQIVVFKLFQFGKVQNLSFGKG